MTWKSLRGDGADNIPGIPRVGDKTAAKLASNSSELDSFLDRDKKNKEIYERNRSLIKFRNPTDKSKIFVGGNDPDFEKIKQRFVELNFRSMVNEKSWEKYKKTFEGILNEDCFK